MPNPSRDDASNAATPCTAVEADGPRGLQQAGNARPTARGTDTARSAGAFLAVAIIAAVTVLAFAPVRHNGFVWDDLPNLVNNEHVAGLSPANLHWMFTHAHGGHYHPLTWLSFALDFHLWGGLSPIGVHYTNLLLHVLTAVGFYFVARRLLGQVHPLGSEPRAWQSQLAGARADSPTQRCSVLGAGALLAALLFAVHPLRVESVAWATERRDVLSGAWLMATVLLYLRATHAATSRRYAGLLAAALLCYAASLLSKAWGITLPFVLLVLDYYPLRRFQQAAGGVTTAPRRVITEKLVFLVPAVVVGLLALAAQGEAGALRTLSEHPLGLRVSQAFFGLCFYVSKTIWPAGLIPLYEQDPHATALELKYLVSAGVVLLAVGGLWWQRRRLPALGASAWVYVLLLAPVLGFAQSGQQVVAERYSYLACLPWVLLPGALLCQLWGRPTRRRLVQPALLLVALALVALLVGLTRSQVRVWRDPYTLWTHVLEHAPATPGAHANLAVELIQRGEYAPARRHALQALEVLPGNYGAHRALAQAALALNDVATAEQHFRRARAIAEHVGKVDVPVLLGLAEALARQEHFAEAADLYREVLEHFSEFCSEPRASARADSRREMAPGVPEARPTKTGSALTHAPELVETYYLLGRALYELGDAQGAAQAWGQGLTRAPRHVRMQARQAWLLATCADDALRDGPRAVELASRAVAASEGRSVIGREALAAAWAETGAFAQALEVLAELSADPELPNDPARNTRLEQARQAYKTSQPFRR